MIIHLSIDYIEYFFEHMRSVVWSLCELCGFYFTGVINIDYFIIIPVMLNEVCTLIRHK